MNKRAKFRVVLGSLVLILGCFLIVFGLYDPILGGCITYTNGTTRCVQSLNVYPIISGVALALLGLAEIAYGVRSKTAS